MDTNLHSAKILRRVREALSDYYARECGESLEHLHAVRFLPRGFSDVVFLEAHTSQNCYRLVMKTTRHHPINRAITEKQNQSLVEFNILKQLYPEFKKVENCSVPRPLLVLPEDETYVMDYVEGHLLLEEHRHARHLSPRRGFNRLRELYFYCGKWLKHFQESTGIQTADRSCLAILQERCESRLKLIEQLGDRRLPHDFPARVRNLLNCQVSALDGQEIPVSGRHGDFGPWNILVDARGITVIDFLGYGHDVLPIDLLKMLVSFEYRQKSLTMSPRRFRAIKAAFLQGFGPRPKVATPLLTLCEAMHRICSVFACLSDNPQPLHERIHRRLWLKANLEWLTDSGKRKLLWA